MQFEYEVEEMEQLAVEYLEEGKQAFWENRLEPAALLVQNALHLLNKVGNLELYAVALNLMGVIYAATGNETMAIDNYLEGLEYAMDNHFYHITPLFYNNIGSRYQELNEHEKAIVYFLKSAKELDNSDCRKNEERHISWSLITYLNLMFSYQELGQYEMAEKYLKIAEPFLGKETRDMHKYTFLILKCRLYWSTGRKEYVYAHLEELLECGTKNENTSDYVQDMKNACGLLMKMGEYEHWKEMILDFEKYAKERNTVYFQLIQTEMWMEYYSKIGEMSKYIRLCVEHAELYQKQKEITDKERVSAIDIKIELREKEAERKRAEIKSTIDALTGLGNRYLMEQDARRLVEEAEKENGSITVGVLDIDCFKQHNDTYGHIRGDVCLKAVADILKKAVKEKGSAYRFGGDEFVILLKTGEKQWVERIAASIKNMLHDEKMENIYSSAGKEVTISQGYACFRPKQGDENSLIEHADKALYQVKKSGRNAYYIIEE